MTSARGAKGFAVELIWVSEGLISVSALIEHLHSQGLPASEDSLQRLRTHDLIGKPKRLGRGKGSAYTSTQTERIRSVLQLQTQLGSNWSFAELAFWIAAHKLHEVPVKLVADHIAASIRLFIEVTNRLTERYATGREEPESTVARRMARYAMQRMIIVRDEPSRQVAELTLDALDICISLWHFNVPPSNVSRPLRRIVYTFYDPPIADEQFLAWQARLTENATMFSSNFKVNRLILVVDKALNKQPNLITLATHDALIGATLLQSGFNAVPDVEPKVGKTNTYLYTRLARAMLPVFAAMSVDIQLANSRNPYLLRLRRGDDLGLNKVMQQLYARK
jgi:hypothetical protein